MLLYFKSSLMHIKSRMEYRASFIFLVLNSFLQPVWALLSAYLLFGRFGSIKGWSLYETLICLSVINFGHAFSEMFFRGFDEFGNQIRTAGFDRMLVRPRGLVLQVLCSRFEFTKLGRGIASLIVLNYSLENLAISWNAYKIIVLIMSLAASVLIFYGILLLKAALCFYTVEGLETANILTDGGREAMQYPITIYNRGFRLFFTYAVPFAVVNYFPITYILEKDGAGFIYSLSPFFSLIFVFICYLIWRRCVGDYKSAGS